MGIHAHFEPVNENVGRCHKDQIEANQCFGGAARIKTAADRIRNEKADMPSIFLNAGDYYQGTIWYSLFKYEPVLEVARLMDYDAMGVGNHDFDDGRDGLLPFAQEAGFPLLAANLNVSAFPEIDAWIDSATILDVQGVKVGVIGYITKNLGVYDSGNIANMTFYDEVESVNTAAKRLKEQGVNIIIAAGHAGYEVDLRMAAEVEDVDLIVGGHSHTFLFSGEQAPSIEVPEGPYPTYVTNRFGKVVPVVQVYCYTKYLGHLELNFDQQGELMKPVDGIGVSVAEPILLDATVEEDPSILEAMQKYAPELAYYKVEIANTTVYLQRNGSEESNLGDLVADALRTCYWQDTTIAVQNNGGIRSNLIVGDITREDVFAVFPFNNTVDRVTMKGKDVKYMLEASVSDLCSDGTCYGSNFLQLSGLRVTYLVTDTNSGNRIQTLKTLCPQQNHIHSCENEDILGDEKWCEVEDETQYNVAMPSFLAAHADRKGMQFEKIHQVGI